MEPGPKSSIFAGPGYGYGYGYGYLDNKMALWILKRIFGYETDLWI
jgi:hypothetical protein